MIYHSSVVDGQRRFKLEDQIAGNFYQGKTLKVLGIGALDYMLWPKYNKCFLNLLILNSVDSGQWVQDPTAKFEDGLREFGHTIVGETILVAAGGTTSAGYSDRIVLLSPNAVSRPLSARLPIGVYGPCSIAINSTSKLGEEKHE